MSPTNDNGGWRGQLQTVSIRADIDIVPNRDKNSDTVPDFRVVAQASESTPASSGGEQTAAKTM
jgi:uncharacterized protein (DUF736 family)